MNNLIQEELWKGEIGVEFQLAETDVATGNRTLSWNVMLPRMAYLTAHTNPVLEYFQEKALEFSSEVWYESSSQVMNCSLPIGLLYDHFISKAVSFNDNSESPWTITVHFQTNHKASPGLATDPKVIEKRYFHALKQSIHILCGSSRLFNELSIEEQSLLWKITSNPKLVSGDSMATFDKLLKAIGTVKNLPVRLLTEDGFVRQRCVKLVDGHGKMKTLADVIKQDFHCDIVSPTIVMHGVEVPPNAEVYSVWESLKYSDLFLYILIVKGTG